ncbi:MAG: hypothetical protein A2289_12600 [Deltaproteobacteria bacterium RIFOXYA12_FULL_58_15]|nr:MAG: hypothetical protein A2289_12600 [Deltaproteobacteria bacterium RIFOXYA12_FULL_58_15]
MPRVGISLSLPSNSFSFCFSAPQTLRPNLILWHDLEAKVWLTADWSMGVVQKDRMNDAIERLLNERLSRMVFQPIVDLSTRQVFGYEALGRSSTDDFPGPMEIVDAAIEAGLMGKLGRHWRELAVDGCTQHPLFVNVRPEEFDEHWLVQPDDPVYWHNELIFLELTESAPLQSFEQCKGILAEARGKGLHLAIDDLGSGYSNLARLVEFQPEIVKLDRALVSGLRPDTQLYRLAAGVIRMCRDMGIRVVAEGVETTQELETVIQAGAHFAQGWVFGQPGSPPPRITWPLDDIAELFTDDRTESQDERKHLLLVNTTEGPAQQWTLPSFVCKQAANTRDAIGLLTTRSFDCVVVESADDARGLSDAFRRIEAALGGAVTPQCLAARSDNMRALSLLMNHSDGFIDTAWSPAVKDAVLNAAIQRVHSGRRLAIQDDLTQLLNRRHFDTLFAAEHHRSRRHERSFAVAMIDLDGLKVINEKFGHRTGSTVIRKVGRVIGAAIRQSDMAFRYGGDEFVILLVETDPKGAQQFCERLCASIGQTEVLCEGNRLSVTASIGFASFPHDGHDRFDVFEKADQALFRAKAAGKNRAMSSNLAG